MPIIIGWILWHLDTPTWVWVLFWLFLLARVVIRFMELESKHGR